MPQDVVWKRVWNHLNTFTSFTGYRHRVLARHGSNSYTRPINLGTRCQFFSRAFTPSEAPALVASQAVELEGRTPSSLEAKAISLVASPLYETFSRGYTKKQWQIDPRDLPESIMTRLPVRDTFNDRYFDDPFEGLPETGHTSIFERMLRHPLIEIGLNIAFDRIRHFIPPDLPVVYTGPIDRYFDHAEGELKWPPLDFETEDTAACAYER